MKYEEQAEKSCMQKNDSLRMMRMPGKVGYLEDIFECRKIDILLFEILCFELIF